MNLINPEQRERVVAARSRILLNQPFLGSLALRLKLREAPDMPTLATDMVHLFYNPEFTATLNDEHLYCAVAHEVGHNMLAHPLRAGDYFQRASDGDLSKVSAGHSKKMNCAQDFALNLILKAADFQVHPTWLCDDQYKDMSAEEIYAVLKDDPFGKTGPGDVGYGGMAKGAGRPAGGQCPCGGVLPHPSLNEGPSAQQAAYADYRIAMSQAHSIARDAGNLPGVFKSLVEDTLNPKISWQDQLRLFVERVTKNDFSWAQPNRRFVSRGFILPTLGVPSIGTVAAACDTSGSCSDEDLAQYAAEMSSMLADANCEKVIMIQCDAQVQIVQEYTTEDLPLKFEMYGRGGTNFAPPFIWLAEEDITPVCMVYLTDGYCSSYAEEPNYPVLWVIVPSGTKDFKPPYGEVVFMEP